MRVHVCVFIHVHVRVCVSVCVCYCGVFVCKCVCARECVHMRLSGCASLCALYLLTQVVNPSLSFPQCLLSVSPLPNSPSLFHLLSLSLSSSPLPLSSVSPLLSPL